MNDYMYLIAFISTCWYGWQLFADVCLDNRPLNTHFGYGLISIISIVNYYPILSLFMIAIVFCYTAIILFCKLDKSKHYENNNTL